MLYFLCFPLQHLKYVCLPKGKRKSLFSESVSVPFPKSTGEYREHELISENP
jgi:hypothetical protein